jgi:hypothetical protein
MIMETITSVSKALQEYERAGGLAPAAAEDTEDVALVALAAHVEPTEDATVQPHVDEGREASLPGPVEAAETSAPVAKPVSAEAGKRRRHYPVQSLLKSRMSRLARFTS